MKKRILSLTLAFALVFALAACGGDDQGVRPSVPSAPSVQDPNTQTTGTPEDPDGPDVPVSAEPVSADPYDAVRNYWSEDQLTQAWGPNQVVEHLFFHPVIAYPQWAFHDCGSSQAQKEGLDDWMVTVDEYNKILQNVYDKGYILVAMEDVWSEVTDANGTHMVRNTLMLPEGKKPLVISFDDVNYYPYMLEEGFTSKLVVNPDDGQIWAECTDPYTGQTFLTQELDATPILDNFVLEHPDFSLNGAKAIFSLTGYKGILGYRTQTDRDITDPAELEAFEANRQKEREAVMPVIQRLKETGWTFGSHTWGHINLSNKSLATVQNDTERWADEVGSLVGPTNILFYPHGARPDGNDWTQTGPIFQYLQSTGFRVFASVGTESFSYIKPDICAVICDRLHPDGTTLRGARSRYLQFYDAKDIIDLSVRPDLPYDFSA